MSFKILCTTLCVATIGVGAAAQAAPFTEKQKAELLASQNAYRTEIGQPALVWSDKLAESAQVWAERLANEIHALKHSDSVATLGENIATWPAGHASLTKLVGIWGAEKKYFVDASFPGISQTGNWLAAAHYSQLVWKRTTDVGCGLATGGGQDYLVCQYNPKGNMDGEKAF